jgi:hypothetical protein
MFVDDIWVEPWYKAQQYSEIGHALEAELFGQTIAAMTEGNEALLSGCFPLGLYGHQYKSGGRELDWTGGRRTMTAFYWPVSLDWYQRFFQTSFWEETVPVWGLEAMRLLPHDTPRLAIAKDNYDNMWSLEKMFGSEEMNFFRIVLMGLWRHRLFILRGYCVAVMDNVRGDLSFRARWRREAMAWREIDWEFVPIMADLRELTTQIQAGAEALTAVQSDNLQEARDQWCEKYLSAMRVPLETWIVYMETVINDHWKIGGGEVMKPVQQLYTTLRRELGDHQVYVYQYFTASVASRRIYYQPKEDYGYDIYLSPMTEPFDYVMEVFRLYRDVANTVADMLIAAALQLQTLDAPNWETWTAWGNRFRQISQVAVDVLAAVEADVNAGDEGLNDEQIELLLNQFWVASVHRKPRTKMLEKLVQRELEVADPRIRQMFFEFQNRLSLLMERPIASTDFINSFQMPDFPAKVRGIVDGLRRIPLGQPANPPKQGPSFGGMFTFNPPPASVPAPSNPDLSPHRRRERLRQRRKNRRRQSRMLNDDLTSAASSGVVKFALAKGQRRRRMRKRVVVVTMALRRIKEIALTRALNQGTLGPVSYGELAEASQASGANVQGPIDFAQLPPRSTLPPVQLPMPATTPGIFPDPWATNENMSFEYGSRLLEMELAQNPPAPFVAPDPQAGLAAIVEDPLS